MADIDKSNIKLMSSERIDDTDQGGGQMTSNAIVDGAVNNLFPDISRLDRVYGRVSLRKAYLAVQTSARETYYGSHTIVTQQAADPNVSVCFFSSNDWFDKRKSAQNRIEAYLVKGPQAQMGLWGTHYRGTSSMSYFTEPSWPSPEIGDVLVLASEGKEQYVRVISVSDETREFSRKDETFHKKIISITIGTQLKYDFAGEEVNNEWNYTHNTTETFTTVAADASRYYGVSTLDTAATAGGLQIKVNSIMSPLVPSAASQTAITDAGVGTSVSPLIQTKSPTTTVTRSIAFNIATNSKLYIGEGIVRGTFAWSGGIILTDDSKGNVYHGSTIVGSIAYATGIVTFGNPGITASGTGTITYTPACSPSQISESGGVIIKINNRGFVYTYNCDPLPEIGTLKVDYLAGGKWYTMWDQGNGQITGSDDTIGSGFVNVKTGSLSVTLGAMPDVGSKVLFFWTKPAEYYDLSGETLQLEYKLVTTNPGVARNTFVTTYVGNGGGTGINGEYAIVDDGNAGLAVGKYSIGNWATATAYSLNSHVLPSTKNGFAYKCTVAGTSGGTQPSFPATLGSTITDGGVTWICVAAPASADWTVASPQVTIGSIKYATGEVKFAPVTPYPTATEKFTIKYNHGEPKTDIFTAPPRDTSGHLNLTLTNTPIIPRTFKIEWHTDLTEYEPETRIDMTIDPTFIFSDDGVGKFDGDVNDGTTGWIKGSINYATGKVKLHPDRRGTFPTAQYKWITTKWKHPGIEQSRVFDKISYLPAMSAFKTDGTVTCTYCTVDGTNQDEYSKTLTPTYAVKESKIGLEIIPGGLSVEVGGQYLIDKKDGKLYTHTDGATNATVKVGTINYVNKTFTITSNNVSLGPAKIKYCSGSARIEPMQSMIFRAPGAPITPGSVFIKGTTGNGIVVQGTADFSGNISADGIVGSVDYKTGLCHVSFGKMVPNDAAAQAKDWYNANAVVGENVWKPYVVKASTIIMNCVIESYLPLDSKLLGLDPVRLPLDGKVPVFRDGYIIVIHHSKEEYLPYPLGSGTSLPADTADISVGRTGVDLIEAYSVPTAVQLSEGTQTVPMLITETGNYKYDLSAGTIKFLSGFVYPVDTHGTQNKIIALSRIEDMALASDVQVTGHISITSPLVHDYPTPAETLVSSVLPSGDLQSRAYGEFEQATWTNAWSDTLIGGIPLASYNFVDYPITVANTPSIKEKWLILFDSSTTVKVVGENFGVLTANSISIATGNATIDGKPCIAIENRKFPGQYYFVMRCDGFGSGWASGNCIRFNQDAANYPLWFIRTTLQAPPTKSVDHYTIQVRGDSS